MVPSDPFEPGPPALVRCPAHDADLLAPGPSRLQATIAREQALIERGGVALPPARRVPQHGARSGQVATTGGRR